MDVDTQTYNDAVYEIIIVFLRFYQQGNVRNENNSMGKLGEFSFVKLLFVASLIIS